MKRVLCVVALLCAISFRDAGAQVIGSVSGTASHGESLLISGASFGTKTVAAPTLWENFNSSSASNGTYITNVLTNWIQGGTGGSIPVFDSAERYGDRGFSALVIQPDPGPLGELNRNLMCCDPSQWSAGPGDKLYASFKFRFTGSSTWTNECPQQYKVGAVGYINDALQFSYPNLPFIYHAQGLQLYSYHAPTGMADDYTNPVYGHFQNTIHSNEWISVEYEITLPSNYLEQDGSVRGWASAGSVVDSRSRSGFGSWDTSESEAYTFDSFWFRNYIPTPAAGCDPTYYLNADDVYVDTSWSRVMIGDSATFASCTRREMQGITAWSNSSVTVTMNQGLFSAGETVYVFVVDSDGVASDGFPITIAGTTTSTEITPPSNLRIGEATE